MHASLPLTAIAVGLLWSSTAFAQAKPERLTDGWRSQTDDQTGWVIKSKELSLHPRAEAKPALKHRFLPDSFDSAPGNAAIYYLKALGFLEQHNARDAKQRYIEDALAKAGGDQWPPYVWLDMAPDQLPIQEMKSYLSYTAFQPPLLKEAARRQRFDMNRNFREVDNPVGYLLPEIQTMRELARTQSMRCRLAIAENRVEDAIEIIGQQYALARHLGQDDFLITNLVGQAIAGIVWDDVLYLVQHRDTPNLYWALTTLPQPLVDMRRSLSVERQFLYQQIKVLQEVDEKPRPAEYWREFLDRLLPQIGMIAGDLNIPAADTDPDAAKASLVALIAAAYPGAKDYLITEQKMPREQVESYVTAQVVFLAMVRFYDHWRDEYFKWTHLPYWQVRQKTNSSDLDRRFTAAAERYGWCASPTELLLPAVLATRTAQSRGAQHIALLQTVEAIRMYAADHDNRLPPNLSALSVPAPIDPFTGKPVAYELLDNKGVLTGHALPSLRYRLILRIAPPK